MTNVEQGLTLEHVWYERKIELTNEHGMNG